jgi:hypothetical protein
MLICIISTSQYLYVFLLFILRIPTCVSLTPSLHPSLRLFLPSPLPPLLSLSITPPQLPQLPVAPQLSSLSVCAIMSSALLDTDGVFGMGRKGGEKGTKICLILCSINNNLSRKKY